jgi:hypothetical protein
MDNSLYDMPISSSSDWGFLSAPSGISSAVGVASRKLHVRMSARNFVAGHSTASVTLIEIDGIDRNSPLQDRHVEFLPCPSDKSLEIRFRDTADRIDICTRTACVSAPSNPERSYPMSDGIHYASGLKQGTYSYFV